MNIFLFVVIALFVITLVYCIAISPKYETNNEVVEEEEKNVGMIEEEEVVEMTDELKREIATNLATHQDFNAYCKENCIVYNSIEQREEDHKKWVDRKIAEYLTYDDSFFIEKYKQIEALEEQMVALAKQRKYLEESFGDIIGFTDSGFAYIKDMDTDNDF